MRSDAFRLCGETACGANGSGGVTRGAAQGDGWLRLEPIEVRSRRPTTPPFPPVRSHRARRPQARHRPDRAYPARGCGGRGVGTCLDGGKGKLGVQLGCGGDLFGYRAGRQGGSGREFLVILGLLQRGGEDPRQAGECCNDEQRGYNDAGQHVDPVGTGR